MENSLKIQSLIFKYGWMLIVRFCLSYILAYIILYFLPGILTFHRADGSMYTLGDNHMISAIMYVFNIAIVILMYDDMQRKKNVSYLLLILTLINAVSSVILYLITSYDLKKIYPMSKKLLNILTKYIILLICYGLLFEPFIWFSLTNTITFELVNNIKTIAATSISILLVILLFFDCRKIQTPTIYLILILISGYLYPLAGVTVFCLIYLARKQDSVEA